ncbi:MAG: prolyl oligopeptidase family serine peptidase [Acidobacteriia bacterium]|nr:prolyl oligopeptidase family serine peptidase [Terriglobia bacterium]
MRHTFRFSSCCLLVSCGLFSIFASAAAYGQKAAAKPGDTAAFTLEQVLSTPFPSDMKASPAGERIAWAFDWKGLRNIWVAEGPEFRARQLTPYSTDDGQEVGDIQFSPDGNTLVYVRGGNRSSGGDIPNPTSDVLAAGEQVWGVRWEGAAPRLLGEGNNPVISPRGDEVAFFHEGQIWIAPLSGAAPAHLFLHVRGENGSPAWSPDGGSLAFVSGRGDHSFIAVYERGSDRVRYMAPSVDRDSNPRWSPDGRRIAFVRQPGRGSDPEIPGGNTPNPWAIWVADVAAGTAHQVWKSSEDAAGSFYRLSGEMVLQWVAGDRLLFTSEQDGWNHFYSMPSACGDPLRLTTGAFEVEQASLTPDRRFVLYSTNEADIERRQLFAVSVEGGAPVQLTDSRTLAWSPIATADGNYLVYLSSDAFRPAMPYFSEFPNLHKLTKNKETSRAELAPHAVPVHEALREFPAAQLVAPETVIFKAADGLEIHGQLFLPKNLKPGTKLPGIVFMHGGPIRQMLPGWHYSYYYHNAYGMNQFLVSRGYVVLSVNYRSGIGYGRDFRMAAKRGAQGASEYQDIVAAGRYLQGIPEVNGNHIGLWGGSYGGYLTALGLARDSDLFKAGVDFHGVHNWVTLGTRFRSFTGPEAAVVRKVAEESSPVASIKTWKSPVLLIQGDDDRNVSFSQMVDLVQRLRKANVSFEQIVFPDEIHDFLMQQSWLKAYHATADFFDRTLKAAPAQ